MDREDILLVNMSDDEVRPLMAPRPKDCHKGSFGYVALIGGSIEYSGAIRLAAMANAAMRSGAGVASIAAPRSICPVIASNILEPTILPLSDKDGELVFKEEELSKICERYDTVAFGMGIGLSKEVVKAVDYLLENYNKTLIVDADGLNAMSKLNKDRIRESEASLVLTPHFKEFSRLSGLSVDEIKDNPESAITNLADELNAVMLLKGSTTYISEPAEYAKSLGLKKRRIFTSDTGCAGMATAGSGDVLSGILSALCVNAKDLTLSVAAGAYINGRAGELAQEMTSDISMTASDTVLSIPDVITAIR